MNNKGLSYIEMVCAIAIIAVLIMIFLIFVKPKLSSAKKDTFINQANTIVKAAINKYTSESNDDEDIYPDDIYLHNKENDLYLGKVCYTLKSLKGKYLEKLDSSFQGSIEICTLSTCKYHTKLWLSNDEYYVDGVKDEITKHDLTKNVLGINRCGITY